MDMPPKRILLIEPDDALRRTLTEQLAGHAQSVVLPAATITQALHLLAHGGADAALLAIGPDDCGQIPALRAGGLSGPLLLLLPPDMAHPPGADDHLVKPIRLSLLLSRLRSLLLRANTMTNLAGPEGDAGHAIGSYRFVPAAKRLDQANGNHIRLTEKETQILEHLIRAGGSARRADLLGTIWGYADGINTHTLETHIYRLRRKLGTGQALLLRVDGGYRLAMEPETV